MEENLPKTKKELFGARIQSKYPDLDITDEEVMYGKINDDYDDYESQLGEYKERESKLTDLFNKDEKSAQFITDMANGRDPFIAVIERLGIDGITDLMNDPAKQEAYAEANKQYVERLANEKKLEDEYQSNFAESMDMLEKMQNERGLGDETIDAAMELVMKIANEAIVGKFSEDTVNMALNAITHDADVDNARAEGTVAGRNAKIEEKLRKSQSGDGMPNLAGSNNVQTQRPQRRSVFDLAGEAR